MTGDLKGRVAQQRAQQENGGNGGEVEKRSEPPKTIAQFIESMKGEIARALPRHLSADRLARIALTEVRRTPKLALSTQESFGGALMTCAQLGLEPGATGEAYLIPRRNGKLSRQFGRDVYEVQLTIGYQGMAKLYWQSPLAKSLDAQAVHEHDEFDFAYGLDPRLFHKPALKDRGAVIAYYSVATMTSGGSAFVVLSPDDVEKFRDRSSSKDDGPWITDYDAMAKKTCVRQMFKLLPRSPELAQALAQDEGIRTDLTESGIDVTPRFVPGEIIPDDPEPGDAGSDRVAGSPGDGTRAPAADLARTLSRFPLGPDADVTAFIQWRAGREVTRLKDLDEGEIAAISAYLAAHESDADGLEAAVSAIWAEFKADREGAPDADGEGAG